MYRLGFLAGIRVALRQDVCKAVCGVAISKVPSSWFSALCSFKEIVKASPHTLVQTRRLDEVCTRLAASLAEFVADDVQDLVWVAQSQYRLPLMLRKLVCDGEAAVSRKDDHLRPS